MCKEGIRIGRKAENKFYSGNVGAGASSTQVIPPNPNRIALIFTGVWVATSGSDVLALITTHGEAPANYLDAVSPYSPRHTLSIEEYGSVLLDRLLVYNPGAGAVDFTVTDVFLNEEIDKI